MPTEGKNWLHAAGVIWPVLVEAAESRTLLRYKDLASVLGTHHRAVRWALGPVQTYCIETKRPALTVLVVGRSMNPGSGFIARDMDNIEAAVEEVRSYNWSAVVNPFGQVGQADTEQSLIRKLVESPEKAEEVYRLVPDRGVAQQLFRAAVALAYNNQCAFCRCSFAGTLDAAHIVPWATATNSQRLDVRNGILLCATHHRMFDNADIAPTADRNIRYCDPSSANGPYTAADTALGPALHNKPMHLPGSKIAWPAAELIEERLTNDGWT